MSKAARDARLAAKASRASSRGSATIAALQAALAAEQAASYGYGVLGAHMTGQRFAAAGADRVAHERARDRLTGMITARGGQPQPAAAAYQLPIAVHSSAAARSLAITLERQVTAAYLGLVAVEDRVLRAFAATNMRDCAVRGARWSGRAQAFPGLSRP
ncbi:MAG: ferritin-like domain-containing protein [Nocardiopsaceae bacterium]|jgi:hypothetical protein|nr:ferritin-like domain-containing protein [Nocardiopsaceae bacterium]